MVLPHPRTSVNCIVISKMLLEPGMEKEKSASRGLRVMPLIGAEGAPAGYSRTVAVAVRRSVFDVTVTAAVSSALTHGLPAEPSPSMTSDVGAAVRIAQGNFASGVEGPLVCGAVAQWLAVTV